jgi:hypothetical protein
MNYIITSKAASTSLSRLKQVTERSRSRSLSEVEVTGRFKQGTDKMLFFWILLFIAAFLGTIALIFYLTLALNQMEKDVNAMHESVKVDYATPPEADKKKKKKK